MCLLIRLSLNLSYALFYFVALCTYNWYMSGSPTSVVRSEGEDEHDCFYAEDNHVECWALWSLEGSHETVDSRNQ